MSYNKYRPVVLDTAKTISGFQKAHSRSAGLFNEITIPAFDVTFPWSGASIRILEFTFNLVQSVSILLPYQVPLLPSFCLAVRDMQGNRYKLWNNVGEILHFPAYLGESFPTGVFFVEVWSVLGSLNALNTDDIVFQMSIQTPESISMCSCSRVATTTPGTEHTDFFSTYNFPYSFNNNY